MSRGLQGDGGWVPEFGLWVVSVQRLLSWQWYWSAVVDRCIYNRESSSLVSDWCYTSGGKRGIVVGRVGLGLGFLCSFKDAD